VTVVFMLSDSNHAPGERYRPRPEKCAIHWNFLGTILDLLNLSIARGHSL
jgi:hypothetical protein